MPGVVDEITNRQMSAITGKPVPTDIEKMWFASRIANLIKGDNPFINQNRFIRNSKDFETQSWEGNPSRFINRSDPQYQESIYAEPTQLPVIDSGGMVATYAGQLAKAAPDGLGLAERLAKMNVSNKTIKKKTGWFKGMDDQWRFEVDDSKGLFAPEQSWVAERRGTESPLSFWEKSFVRAENQGPKLKDIYRNEELYSQYPELKDVRVGIWPREALGEDTRGQFTGNIISLADDLEPKQAHDTLVHEIQHWIQHKEGFARGGSPEIFDREIKSIQTLRDQHYSKLKFLERESGLEDFRKPLFERLKNGEITGDEYRKLNQEFLEISPFYEDYMATHTQYSNALEKIGELSGKSFDRYQNLAGEIEARDASNRRTWDMALRQTMMPELKKDAIVRGVLPWLEAAR